MVLQSQVFSGQPLSSNQKKKIRVCRTTLLQPEKRSIFFFQIYSTFSRTHLIFWSTTFLEPDFSNQISRTTFLEPLFYNFLEKWLQNKWSNMCHLGFCPSWLNDGPVRVSIESFYILGKLYEKWNLEQTFVISEWHYWMVGLGLIGISWCSRYHFGP